MRANVGFLIFAIIITVITASVLQSIRPSTWKGWEPATCMTQGCFCEADHFNRSIRQPVNTLSSFAFVFAASIILMLNERRRKQRESSTSRVFYVAPLAISAIVIGLGSAFFHASLSLVGQFFDVVGMYLLATFIVVYAGARLYSWSKTQTLILYLALNALLDFLLFVVPETRRYAFALIILIAIAIETRMRFVKKPRIRVVWWNVGFVLLALGYAIWVVDNFRLLCEPGSILQGHAVWHVLGAAAMVLLYKYYDSEGFENRRLT